MTKEQYKRARKKVLSLENDEDFGYAEKDIYSGFLQSVFCDLKYPIQPDEIIDKMLQWLDEDWKYIDYNDFIDIDHRRGKFSCIIGQDDFVRHFGIWYYKNTPHCNDDYYKFKAKKYNYKTAV